MKGIIVICPIIRPFIDALDEHDDIGIAVALNGHTFVVFGDVETTSRGPVQVTLDNHDEVCKDKDVDLPMLWHVTADGHDKLVEFVEASLHSTEADLRATFEASRLDKELVALNQGDYNTEGFTA